jgi:membrane-associated phospholipid phosphatase
MSIADKVTTDSAGPATTVARRTVLNLTRWLASIVSGRRVRPASARPAWARPGRLLLGAGAAFAVILATMVWVDDLGIALQRRLSQPQIDLFDAVTDLGRSGWVLTPVAVAIIVLAAVSSPALGRTRQLVLASVVARLGFVFTAVALPGVLVTVVKRLIGRARPYTWESVGPFDFAPFGWQVDFASLPSGHGTTAFAAAFAIGALFPRLRIPLWILAILIGISRVAVSAHYPSDILAGAVIGIFGALVVRNWFAARRLGFLVAQDRSVRALPGPSWRRIKALMLGTSAPSRSYAA